MKKKQLVKKTQNTIIRRQGQSRCLDEKEIKRVIKLQVGTTYEKRNICLLTMGFYGGCRVGELSNLTIGDVFNKDWTIKEVVILRKEYTKTKQTRQLFLTNEHITKSINNYITERKETEGLDLTDFKRKLFRTQKSDGFSGRTLQRCLKLIFKNSGLDEMVSTHSMRRTFITNLFENGVDVKIVSKLVGHTNIQTTLNTYYTVRDDRLKEITRDLVLR
jgi:integrase/recombinase XerD